MAEAFILRNNMQDNIRNYTNDAYAAEFKLNPINLTPIWDKDGSVHNIDDIVTDYGKWRTKQLNGETVSNIEWVLSQNNENDFESRVDQDYNGADIATYNSEGQYGAYAGYIWNSPKTLHSVKIWLGRYIGQNKTLYVTLQYFKNNTWHDIDTIAILKTSESDWGSHRIKSFTQDLQSYDNIMGIRWAHFKDNINGTDQNKKTSSNTILFDGMILYEKIEEVPIYKVTKKGFIPIPENYSGFGALYIDIE